MIKSLRYSWTHSHALTPRQNSHLSKHKQENNESVYVNPAGIEKNSLKVYVISNDW